METHIVRRDMDKDLQFTGRMIASVASTPDQTDSECYSGYINEWTELRLYRTQTGAFVCNRITRIAFDGEMDIHEGCICNTLNEMVEFFGADWLAKKLFDEAGIEAVQMIAWLADIQTIQRAEPFIEI